MTKKGHIMIYKTLHRRQTIEQHEPQLKPEVPKKVMLFLLHLW